MEWGESCASAAGADWKEDLLAGELPPARRAESLAQKLGVAAMERILIYMEA